MKSTNRSISRFYLYLVPLLVVVLGFGIGKISYTIYLPVWLINVVLMIAASWVLGLHTFAIKNEKTHIAAAAFLLVVPWIIVSMFFGLGPPPATAEGWEATAVEQQVRYSMLVAAGIFIAFGFSLLKEKLKNAGESFYASLGFSSIIIAIPLFLLNMLFWGFSLTAAFRILVSTGSTKMPEWFGPARALFGMLSTVEVALTYLATAFFALSLYRVGWLGQTASRVYIVISILAFVLDILSSFLPGAFITAGYAVSIPAIPFLMPYFMGVHLLHRMGTVNFNREFHKS